MTAAAILAGTAVEAAAQAGGRTQISFSDNFYAGTSDSLSFWASHAQGGIVPLTGGNVLKLAAMAEPAVIGRSGISWDYGAELAAVMPLGDGKMRPILSECHAGASWKDLGIEAGLFRKKSDFAPVSITGGDITNTGNARNQPGYSISLDGWTLPFLGERFSISGSWGDYVFLGPRFISNPLVHNEEGYLDVKLTGRLTLRLGGEDWGMWGGKGSPKGVSDYFRMALGLEGGASATAFDQVNALGNHLGRTLLRLSWQGNGWMASLSKDSPFEDASGIKQKNFPDGVWTAYLHRDKAHAWVSDMALELIYTKCQSGSLHARPATEEEMARQDPSDPNYGTVIMGGQDEYFNHYWYSSGWTSYGMTIGLPLMLPYHPAGDGICYGIRSNVCEGVHFGASGYLMKLYPYRFRATYSRMYGRSTAPFAAPVTLLSVALDGTLPHNVIFPDKGTRLDFSYGLYADAGTLYFPRLSFMFGVKYTL